MTNKEALIALSNGKHIRSLVWNEHEYVNLSSDGIKTETGSFRALLFDGIYELCEEPKKFRKVKFLGWMNLDGSLRLIKECRGKPDVSCIRVPSADREEEVEE